MSSVPEEFTALEQLRVWIETVTGLSTFWRDQPEQFVPGGHIVLNMVDIDTVGQDGVRYDYDGTKPLGQEMVPTVVGQREFTLRAEARSWTQELALTAEAYLETIRLSLRLPTAQAVFQTVNVGFVRARVTQHANVVVDERVQSRAVLDLRFTTTIELTVQTEGTGYIETVDVETTYRGGVDGDIVVEQPQLGNTTSHALRRGEPAIIAGDKVYAHWRSSDLGALDNLGRPLWLNGLDNFRLQWLNAVGSSIALSAAQVIDGYRALAVPGTQSGYRFLTASIQLRQGDRLGVYCLTRINSASDTAINAGIILSVASAGNPARCARFRIDRLPATPVEPFRVAAELSYEGDGGTAARREVAVEVPQQRAHLLEMHYDDVDGLLVVDGEQYPAGTGGAGVAADLDFSAGPCSIVTGTLTGAAAGHDLVDVVVAVGLTAAERTAIRGYFGARYPSLRLS